MNRFIPPAGKRLGFYATIALIVFVAWSLWSFPTMDKEGRISVLTFISLVATAAISWTILNRIDDSNMWDPMNKKTIFFTIGVFAVFGLISYVLVKVFV